MFFRVVRRLPACAVVCGAALFSISSLADTTIFTALDDPAQAKKPFEGNVQAGYSAQTGNTSNSTLNADTTMTWFDTNTAYSLWGSGVHLKNIRLAAVRATTWIPRTMCLVRRAG